MPHCFKLAHRIARFRRLALGSAVVLVAACSDALGPVEDEQAPIEQTPTDVPPITDTPVVEDPSLATISHPGIPFGFFAGDYYDLGSVWTSTKRGASVSSIKKYLSIARQRHARVFIQFAGSSKHYLNSDGSFSLTKWKEGVAAYKNVDLSSYIADGTLAGHYMIDEPDDESNWGGHEISYSQLEAAAKYSKSVFPGLTTIVRVVPTWLKGASFQWVYLDAAWAQYSARKGDVYDYRDHNIAAARDEGLGLIFGLNVLDGGDGSSGFHGNKSTRWAMSASELTKYGNALIGASYACGFMMWKYTDTYVGRSSILSALKNLSAAAKERDTAPCKRS